MKTKFLFFIALLLCSAVSAAEWAAASVTEGLEDRRRYITVIVSGTDGVTAPKSFKLRVTDKNRKRIPTAGPKYNRTIADQVSYLLFMSEETVTQREQPVFRLTISADRHPSLTINHRISS